MSQPHRGNLRSALRIVVIALDATTLSTSRRSSPANTTTLSVERGSGTGATTSSSLWTSSGSGSAAAVALAVAVDWRGSGNGVGIAIVVWLTVGGVDLDLDTGVGGGVGTWEGDGAGWGEGTAVLDVDLDAGDVELSKTDGGSTVKSEQLNTEKVVAGSKAAWELEVPPSTTRDHGINSPTSTVEALVGNLEPSLAARGCRVGIADLGKVDLNWSLVGSSNWVIWVALELGTANDVSPKDTSRSTGWNIDHRAGLGTTSTTGHIAGVHIFDWIIARWGTESNKLTLVGTVDSDSVSDGVSVSSGGQADCGEEGGKLHRDWR